MINDGLLKIRDRELLAKVKRSCHRLYLLDLKVQPICLAAQRMEEPWLWHARFGHLSFDALGRLESMVRGLPHIEHDAWPFEFAGTAWIKGGVLPHRAVLAAAKWRGGAVDQMVVGMAQLMMRDQEDAGGVLG